LKKNLKGFSIKQKEDVLTLSQKPTRKYKWNWYKPEKEKIKSIYVSGIKGILQGAACQRDEEL